MARKIEADRHRKRHTQRKRNRRESMLACAVALLRIFNNWDVVGRQENNFQLSERFHFLPFPERTFLVSLICQHPSVGVISPVPLICAAIPNWNTKYNPLPRRQMLCRRLHHLMLIVFPSLFACLPMALGLSVCLCVSLCRRIIKCCGHFDESIETESGRQRIRQLLCLNVFIMLSSA